jgi:hypothetical protein
MVEHRLVEVRRIQRHVRRQDRIQRPGDDAGPGGGFQDAAARDARGAVGDVGGVRREEQRPEVLIV